MSVLSSEDCEVSFIEVALRIAINMIPYTVVWSVFTVCPRCWTGVWNAKQTISSWESSTRSTRSLGLLICSPISRSACSKQQNKTIYSSRKTINLGLCIMFFCSVLLKLHVANIPGISVQVPSQISTGSVLLIDLQVASYEAQETPGISGESGDIQNRSRSGPISAQCGIAEAKALLLHGVFHVFS